MTKPTNYKFQPETVNLLGTLQGGGELSSVHSMALGVRHAEPALVIIDSAIRFAKAYHQRFNSRVCNDPEASAALSSILTGARSLLNFHGAAATEINSAIDSKDNTTLEKLFWTACEVAGLDGEEL